MIVLLYEILLSVFYKNSLDVFDVMKLQLRINNCTYYISSWINKHDCSFTQKISSTFLFLIFHKIELSLHSNFLITSRDTTNNGNVLHKQSRLILYIKHNFHSLSRIQFFFPSQSLSLFNKIKRQEERKKRIISSLCILDS